MLSEKMFEQSIILCNALWVAKLKASNLGSPSDRLVMAQELIIGKVEPESTVVAREVVKV